MYKRSSTVSAGALSPSPKTQRPACVIKRKIFIATEAGVQIKWLVSNSPEGRRLIKKSVMCVLTGKVSITWRLSR